MTKQDKQMIAGKIAKSHFAIEENMQRICLLESHPPASQEIVELLEVVDGTLEFGIEPVSFPPDPARGLPYPSTIIEVSPREFTALKGRMLRSKSKKYTWKITGEFQRDGKFIPAKA